MDTFVRSEFDTPTFYDVDEDEEKYDHNFMTTEDINERMPTIKEEVGKY